MSLILPSMWSMDCLVVKVLKKIISLICFRVYLEVIVFKNPTCFSRWSFSELIHELWFLRNGLNVYITLNVTVLELVDKMDSKSIIERCKGSNPFSDTI